MAQRDAEGIFSLVVDAGDAKEDWVSDSGSTLEHEKG
eukprot:CAMPEP_0184687944 /NCGR_PEP_ID=MMETSP0312-20130426/28065_1 /TAXON_ID=31354 /ORGANISM="Compsopogon coeruleus, Strain SAG 36.94" /LENGTH=36 /DNA_ID= /DNA_START= /DNA_END= /DNA_ORIENTATION=